MKHKSTIIPIENKNASVFGGGVLTELINFLFQKLNEAF
jgi:hypothetical protein